MWGNIVTGTVSGLMPLHFLVTRMVDVVLVSVFVLPIFHPCLMFPLFAHTCHLFLISLHFLFTLIFIALEYFYLYHDSKIQNFQDL